MLEVDEVHPAHCVYISAVCRLVSSPICYPHEVIRTRLQAACEGQRKYYSFLQTLLKVWREEGRRGLYGGLGANLIRVVPNCAVAFFSFEYTLTMLRHIT